MPYRMRLWVLLTGCLLLLPLFAADPPNDRLETQLARALSVTLLPEGKVTQVTAGPGDHRHSRRPEGAGGAGDGAGKCSRAEELISDFPRCMG